ncbi:hypothetical protein TL16_g00259 [Triparma laevis f. inornata]|uniref:Uncharacterized protein n=2 Tax=Triparma laevis TaxID=1534972 RepID=A0A9W7FQV1_9STRA|nr:hypothetical protein TL16_g00259 [Triparma laevis f. inornata]GMI17302.1 hypothetical protein TrLO_g674 [Triparma laevis f. longispina]
MLSHIFKAYNTLLILPTNYVHSKLLPLIPQSLLSLKTRKVAYALLTLTLLSNWIAVAFLNLSNNSDRLKWATTMSNGSVLPAALFISYQIVINGKLTWLVDGLFAIFTSNSSMIYHFCDATDPSLGGFDYDDRLAFCKWKDCWDCEEWWYEDDPSVSNDKEGTCCYWRRNVENYNFWQHMDFAGSYFLILVIGLSISKIEPIPLKVLIYLFMFRECYKAMDEEFRFANGEDKVLEMAYGVAGILACRLIFNVTNIYNKVGAKATCRTLIKCVPKRVLLMALTFMAGGLYCKFFWENEGQENPETYTQADYSIPHTFWHVGVFGACLPISWFAIEFNRRCLAVWDEEAGAENQNSKQAEAQGVEMVQEGRQVRNLSTESSESNIV